MINIQLGACKLWHTITVLGPLLFVQNINNLPKSMQSIVHKMHKTIKTIQDLIDFHKDPGKLKKWVHKWGIKFNPSKCQLMKINQSKQPMEMFHILSDQVHQN